MKRQGSNGLRRFSSRLFTVLACGVLFFASSADASGDKVKKVKIRNQSDSTIWVMIQFDQKHAIETKSKVIKELDFEAYYKMMMEGKVALPIEGVPIDASGKESVEFKNKLRTYYEEHQEAKYEYSEFIQPGELKIAAGETNDFSLSKETELYYISIRAMGAEILANNVPRSESSIEVTNNGIADAKQTEITKGMPVYFQKDEKGGHFIGDPIKGKNQWDAATYKDTAGKHHIEPWSGSDLASGTAVRIVTSSANLADAKFNVLYSSDVGNVYYDKHSDDGKQKWKISKTDHPDNSSGDKLRFGDRVRITSLHWPKANLGINGDWLQCVTGENTVWILRKDPRSPDAN